MRGIIIKDDKRYCHTQSHLERAGHIFGDRWARNPDFVIFPFAADVDEKAYDADFFAELPKGALVFSGIRKAYSDENCKKQGLRYHVLMDDKDVARKNAVPTTEGVLAYLLLNRDETLSGSRILVIGYGICGRDLAVKLAALNAHVTALVRRSEKEAETRADGIAAIYLRQFKWADYDIIINTVPAAVLPQEALDACRGVMLIDIASAPYGFDLEQTADAHEKSARLSGIPGKHAVKTAGEILGEHIGRILELEERQHEQNFGE